MEELLAALAAAVHDISRAEAKLQLACTEINVAVANAKHILTRIEERP